MVKLDNSNLSDDSPPRESDTMRRLDCIMGDPYDTRPWGSMERRSQETSYSITWLASIYQGSLPEIKVGLGLFLAVLIDGYNSFFTKIFAFAIIFWALDMVLGTLRAFADPNIRMRWSKSVDGLIRLLVICAIALAIAMAEHAVLELSGVDVSGRLLTIAYTFIIVGEFSSIIGNAAYFYPQLAVLKDKLVEFLPSYTKNLKNEEEEVSNGDSRSDFEKRFRSRFRGDE